MATEGKKYCDIIESLKKNDKAEGFIASTVRQRTDRIRTVKSILDVMVDEYSCKIEEKTLKQNVQSNIYSEISKVKQKIVQMQSGEEDLNV